MYSLKDHIQNPVLTESSKNVHIEHVEDLILDDGFAGAHISINLLSQVANTLTSQSDSNVDLTVKWDGSPAIVCGTDPQTGRFFIGTKSVFSKRNPKICFTEHDIAKHYKDSPGLVRQMELAFKHLPKINIKGVLQGDLMFNSSEIQLQTIYGQEYVTFKPNTIMYAIPAESELAEKVRRAKIGIVFHTTYKGDSLKDMTPSFKVNLDELTPSEDVWFDDATYKDVSGAISLTQDESENIKRHLDSATETLQQLNPLRFEELLTSKTLIGMIKMFTNSRIRSGKQFDSGFMSDLKKFVEQRIDKEKIRDQTKESKKQEYARKLNKLEPVLSDIFSFQHEINEVKLILIKKLHKINNIGTFVPTGDGGYKAIKHEGFVAVDHLTSKVVKLVDRLEFSRTNQLRYR